MAVRVGVGGIKKLQEFNEFATAMAVFHQSLDLAGQQVDAGQQADRAEALIFMIAGEGRMLAGLQRQVRCRGGKRLDPWLLVKVKPHKVRYYLERCDPEFKEKMAEVLCVYRQVKILKETAAASNQRRGCDHLLFPRIEDLAHRALDQLIKACVALRGPMLPRVVGQKPGRPQLVRIPQVLRIPTGQRHQPSLGLGGDLGLFARPRTIVERRDRAVGEGPLNTPLNRLMTKSQRARATAKKDGSSR
jgi:hypothetical protein